MFESHEATHKDLRPGSMQGIGTFLVTSNESSQSSVLGDLLRLSVDIEDTNDLIVDL